MNFYPPIPQEHFLCNLSIKTPYKLIVHELNVDLYEAQLLLQHQ